MKIPVAVCFLAATLPALAQEERRQPQAVPADSAPQADSAEDLYQHGRDLFEAAKSNPDIAVRREGYAKAIEVFNRCLKESPKNPEAEAARWYLGQACYGSGRIEEAEKCFELLLKDPGQGKYAAAAAYTLAAGHFNHRDFAPAAALFEKLAQIATRPEERQRGNYYAGVCDDVQGLPTEASAFFRKVVDDPEPANPFKTKAQFSLGRILVRSGRLEEGLALLGQVVDSSAGANLRGDAAVQAGTIAAKLGKEGESDRYFTLVMSTPGLETARVDALLGLMAARFQQQRYQEVIDLSCQSGLKAEGGKEADRLMIAAKSLMQLGRHADALELLGQVERLDLPADSYSYEVNYLRLLSSYRTEDPGLLGQADAFLALYKSGHAQDPRIQSALLLKASSLLTGRQIAAAAKAFAEVDPSLVDAVRRGDLLYNRGYCAFGTGDARGVIDFLTRFIADFPGDPKIRSALMMRAKGYFDTRKFVKASADYALATQKPKDQ